MSNQAPNVERATDQPFLTVVMPLHEGSDWIGATMETLAREHRTGVEIVAIDSSSTATTSDIVKTFADRLPIHLIHRPDLKAWPTKTNLGIELAKTKYVCMLHQDDLWLPGRSSAVSNWIREAPDAVLHLAPSFYVDRAGKRVGAWRCPLPSNKILDRDLLLGRLLVQNFVSVPAPVILRDAWLACGGMDDALWYTADWDIWLKLASFGPTIYHDEFTTGFRIHGSSLTVTGSRSASDFRMQMETVLDRHAALHSDTLPPAIERAARASITMNVAMAAASAGDRTSLPGAIKTLFSLGLGGMARYVRDSRLHERIFSRLRARLAGAF